MNPLKEIAQKRQQSEDGINPQESVTVPREMTAPDLPQIGAPAPPPIPEPKVNVPPPPGLGGLNNTDVGGPQIGPPKMPEEIVTVPTPIDESKPVQTPKTLFTWNKGKAMTEEQREIIESGKTPEQLTPDELRKVYYHVTAIPGRKIYSATTVTYIEKHGIHPDEGDREENESLFVGTEVHSAMETKGASIRRLKCFGDIGTVPEKPETKVKLSKDHTNIIREIAVNNLTPAQAYLKAKDNTTTKAVTMEELMEYEKDNTIYDHEDPKSDEGKALEKKKKAVEKLITAGSKEFDKIKPDLNVYGKYLKDLEKWEVKKQTLREKGGFIIDDLDYISDSGVAGKRIRDKIQACYGSLASNTEVMDQYYMEDKNENLESYVELPILWKLTIGNKQLPAKSMLDKVHFDFQNKVVFLQDIKTHAKHAEGFVYTNYIGHKYYRAMSFYTEAVKYYLENYRGITDIDDWKFISVLLPVSTISYEVGCYHPYLILSPEDIVMGKYGGFHKSSQASYFDEHDRVQYALTHEFFEKQKEIGLIHERAVDKRVKGWIEIVDRFERQFKPKNV